MQNTTLNTTRKPKLSLVATNNHIDFRNDQQMNDTFNELVAVKEEIKLLRQYEETFKTQIQLRMGDCEKAFFESGEISWKISKDNTYLDTERLLMDHPRLFLDYTVNKSGIRKFYVKV